MTTEKTQITEPKIITFPVYKVTKQFTGGLLKGLIIDEITSTKFVLGYICSKPCCNSSPYTIIACVKVGTKTLPAPITT